MYNENYMYTIIKCLSFTGLFVFLPIKSASVKAPTRHATISAEQLQREMQANPSMRVIQVLGPKIYNDCRIKYSDNIPLDQLTQKTITWNKDQRIIFYCTSKDCIASRMAYDFFANRGFQNIAVFEDGMAEWFSRKLPVEGPCKKSYLTQKMKKRPSPKPKARYNWDKIQHRYMTKLLRFEEQLIRAKKETKRKRIAQKIKQLDTQFNATYMAAPHHHFLKDYISKTPIPDLKQAARNKKRLLRRYSPLRFYTPRARVYAEKTILRIKKEYEMLLKQAKTVKE